MADNAFKKSTLREYFESIVIAVILALFIRTFVVQAFKTAIGRHLDPPPDCRGDVEQSDRDADDRILHAASLTRSRFQFQGNSSLILLAG